MKSKDMKNLTQKIRESIARETKCKEKTIEFVYY